MNVYDSARMADVLAPLGYSTVDDAAEADLVILNTCHIREKAAEKIYSELGRLRRVKESRAQSGGSMLLGVAGCVAQAEGDEVRRRAPHVDLVVGPQSYHRLPELLRRLEGRLSGQVAVDFPPESKFDTLPENRNVEGAAAFLTVQEGCDKFCSFCVVPYTRGAEYSRPAAAVLAEAKSLSAAGAREITLLGQNVNCYHGEGIGGGEWSLARLIAALADIDGIERIRYTTSYPADITDDLVRAHGKIPALMPFLHLPVQSGSDRVLKAMNRRHSADDYRRIIGKLREARPDIALSSDFIVGFPGEEASDFEATLALVADIGFAQAYSFKYSARPGTPAAAMEDQIPGSEKDDRLRRLQELLNAQQIAFNRAAAGCVMPVLLDREGRRPGQLVGRSPYMQAVHVDADGSLFGSIVDVRIVEGLPNSLRGERVRVAARAS